MADEFKTSVPETGNRLSHRVLKTGSGHRARIVAPEDPPRKDNRIETLVLTCSSDPLSDRLRQACRTQGKVGAIPDLALAENLVSMGSFVPREIEALDAADRDSED